MVDRLIGIITLKPPVYREVAHDENATTQAAIIVIVMAIFSGVVGGLVLSAVGSSLPPEAQAQAGAAANPVAFAIRTIITAIISWLIGAWVIAFVAKTFFGGQTNTGEMLRVFGFTQIFQVIAIIPCIGAIVALVLSIIGAIIGIREASGFDTTKAILTGIVAFVALIIVSFVLGAILAIFGL